jgi:hypothetical protein
MILFIPLRRLWKATVLVLIESSSAASNYPYEGTKQKRNYRRRSITGKTSFSGGPSDCLHHRNLTPETTLLSSVNEETIKALSQSFAEHSGKYIPWLIQCCGVSKLSKVVCSLDYAEIFYDAKGRYFLLLPIENKLRDFLPVHCIVLVITCMKLF